MASTALESCLTRPVYLDADLSSSVSIAAQTSSKLDSNKANDRCAVRLNVPTVANLRRQSSVTSLRKSWPRYSITMPASSEEPSFATSSNNQTSFFEEGGYNASLKEPVSLSASRPPSRSNPISTQRRPQSSNPSSGSRRGSLKSDSAESSPTTTISTLDSTLTEPSPSSSPESPTNLVPLISLNALGKTQHTSGLQGMDRRLPGLPLQPSRGYEQSESPNKKGKNVKCLSINTNGISATRPQTAPAPSKQGPSDGGIGFAPPVPSLSAAPGNDSTAKVASHPFSEPTSPSFIVPNVPKPRRSKLNLTISTADSSGPGLGPIPATPAFAPPPKTPAFGKAFTTLASMRENEETLFSPSGAPAGGMRLPPFGRSHDPTLPTPSQGPEGGMTLPPFGGYPDFSPARPTSRPALNIGSKSFEGGAGSTVVNQTIEHRPQMPLHDLPLSQEVKSPSYPDGPACIYPPNVFLYHQPTCEEAREFDVIINVAREVINPFELAEQEREAEKAAKGYADSGVQCDLLPAPPLSLAFAEVSGASEEEPATPKASTPRNGKKMPEYHHLPWEHNSNVYLEWLEVCEMIDKKSSEGKKVLIHCQLGVSRSASLIVAYGLYKNPSLTPDEAREQAKEKSRWIDLNMHFMYELGDFKKVLVQKFGEDSTVHPAGLGPITRTNTDFASHVFEGEGSLEESKGSRDRLPEPAKKENEVTEPMSAFPGSSTLPFGRDAAPLPPLPITQIDLPLRQLEDPPTAAESESSSSTTPVQGEIDSDRMTPQRTKTNDSDKTLKASISSEPAETAPQLPVPSGLFSPTTTSFGHGEVPSVNALTPAKAVSTAAAIQDSPQIPDPTPPRRLRPMPSLPAGFSSLRKASPALTLDTNATSPSLEFLKSPPVPGSRVVNQDPNIPQLPSLDLGSSTLMSPRTTEFTMNPFHRSRNSLAGDLAGFDFLMSPGAQERDPRSPPIRGDGSITRNIYDVL